MAGFTRFKNAYQDQGVVLVPISDEIQTDQNLEPQMVRIRSSNTGFMFLNSEDRDIGKNKPPVDIILSTRIKKTKVKRWSAVSFIYLNVTPNVNDRNRNVTFFSTNSGTTHTVQIIQGFYETRLALMDALVLALNTATGASGLTFSHVIPVINPLISTLNSAGCS